jgi:hypothetical protein
MTFSNSSRVLKLQMEVMAIMRVSGSSFASAVIDEVNRWQRRMLAAIALRRLSRDVASEFKCTKTATQQEHAELSSLTPQVFGLGFGNASLQVRDGMCV